MAQDYPEIAFRLVAALLAGGLIGIERSYRGRDAGFRTHALVCLASALLMMVTVYESHWFRVATAGARVTIDPTRMAQGIMTGIGFLGAGVIVKEGLSVRGLTTAASIWVTAVIGVLSGIGFYFAAAAGTLLTLDTLSLFRWVESKIPTERYASFTLRFERDAVMPEADLRRLVAEHGFFVSNLSYRVLENGAHFEYRMVLRAFGDERARALSDALRTNRSILEYRIAPAGD